MSTHSIEDDISAIGIDLGGIKIEVALVDWQRRVENMVRQPTEAEDGYTVVNEHILCIKSPLFKDR